MRLWTLHPCYLDPQGLVALWREALLAQAVLAGLTRGYRRHPQLERFEATPQPVDAIGAYLREVAAEAGRRGYSFDGSRIRSPGVHEPLAATEGQLAFEWGHLCAKLERRNPAVLERIAQTPQPLAHPLFFLVPGPKATWERGT